MKDAQQVFSTLLLSLTPNVLLDFWNCHSWPNEGDDRGWEITWERKWKEEEQTLW